jgi:hypothetical protein
VPTKPDGVGTAKVGFIDIIAFGTDNLRCLYDIMKSVTCADKVVQKDKSGNIRSDDRLKNKE